MLALPLEFISFAHIRSKMYEHYNKDGTFVFNYGREYGNRVVYGVVFALSDFDYYIHILDAYHLCSLSNLKVNHDKDTHHRVVREATLISFNDLDELKSLKYSERLDTDVFIYEGNINNPKIKHRIAGTTASYRIESGLTNHFIEQYNKGATL